MPNSPKHVRLLMATRDGAAYLRPQLDSLIAQTHTDWSLDVADDGSRDETRKILREYAAEYPQIRYFYGPGRGVAANFLFLLARAVRERPDALISFTDQDDVWMPDKLTNAVRWFASQSGWHRQAMAYCCRAILTDAELNEMGTSSLPPRGASFGNALVQNILPGNATVLSPRAAAAVARTVPAAIAADVPFHDWWVYLALTGQGATIFNDEKPGLFYRQHKGNQLGHHSQLRGRWARFGLLVSGAYGEWIDRNLRALEAIQGSLTSEAMQCLGEFIVARKNAELPQSVHRQSAMGDHLLLLLAKTGRLSRPSGMMPQQAQNQARA